LNSSANGFCTAVAVVGLLSSFFGGVENDDGDDEEATISTISSNFSLNSEHCNKQLY
jgi:hypothetical protein